MDSEVLKAKVDLVSKTGALAAVAFYVIGFIIITIQHATYGIVEFSLFRARVLAAGILFAVLFGLPFAGACRTHGLFGFPALWPSPTDKERGKVPKSDYWIWVAQGALFANVAWVTGFFFWLFLGDYHHWLRFLMVYLTYIAVIAALQAQGVWTRFWNRPALYANLLVSVSVAGLISMTIIKEWYIFFFIAWCMYVRILAAEFDSIIQKPQRLKEVNWHKVPFNCVALLSLFAIFFYPKFRPSLGGGKPTKVVMQFLCPRL